MRQRRHNGEIEPLVITIPPKVLTRVPGVLAYVQHEGPGDQSYTLRGGKRGVFLVEIPSYSTARWFITVPGEGVTWS